MLEGVIVAILYIQHEMLQQITSLWITILFLLIAVGCLLACNYLLNKRINMLVEVLGLDRLDDLRSKLREVEQLRGLLEVAWGVVLKEVPPNVYEELERLRRKIQNCRELLKDEVPD